MTPRWIIYPLAALIASILAWQVHDRLTRDIVREELSKLQFGWLCIEQEIHSGGYRRLSVRGSTRSAAESVGRGQGMVRPAVLSPAEWDSDVATGERVK